MQYSTSTNTFPSKAEASVVTPQMVTVGFIFQIGIFKQGIKNTKIAAYILRAQNIFLRIYRQIIRFGQIFLW